MPDNNSRTATTTDVLILSPPERAETIAGICREMGLSTSLATTAQEAASIAGHFVLGIVDMHGVPSSPFDMAFTSRMRKGALESIRLDRAMTLEIMEPIWGLQRAHSIKCSGYARLDLDEQGHITENGRQIITEGIRDVLNMPPYEDVSYYDEVPETAIHGLIESSQAPIVVIEPNHTVWFANLAAQAIFRRPTHLMKGLPVHELMATPGEAERFMSVVRNIQNIAGDTLELRMKARDNSQFDALVIINRVFHGPQRDVFVGFTLHDITKRKEAEEALRSSEESLVTLFENAPDGLMLIDDQGRIFQVNEALCDALGYSESELLNRHAFDLEHFEPGHSENRVGLTRSLRGSKASRLVCYHRKDGSLLTLEVCETLLNLPGRRRSMLVSFRDVTDRKRAEDTLRESERQFRELLENVQMVAVMLDPRGVITFCNDYLLRITGRQREDVLGANWFDNFVPAKGEVRGVFDRMMSGTEYPVHFENDILTSDGERRRIAWNNTLRRDPQGRILGLTSIGEDITDRIILEEQLRQAQKMEAVGQLAGGIAHDFNNLLTGILGNLSLALTDVNEQQKGRLMEAEKASLRAAGLVKQLLAFSRRSQAVMKPTDLGAIVDEVAEIARNTFDRRIEFRIQQSQLLRPVMADAGQLHQILLNLCVNARDALEQKKTGSAPPELRITIDAENVDINEEYCQAHGEASRGRFVRIDVSDTGAGMDAYVLKHLFEPFFTTKELGKGTGLGLAMVYGIVKQHKGWINVYSEVGKGSTFHIYLPAAERQEMEPASVIAPPAEAPHGNETILVVDDEEVIRNVAEAILTRLGYKVLLAGDGKEGLNRFLKERNQIGVVLLDLSMPFLSGQEVLEQIRAVDPKAKVILSSGYALDGQMENVSRLNASGYVAKPYRLSELACTIRRVLDNAADPAVMAEAR